MAIGENYNATKTRYVFLQSIYSKLMVSLTEISFRIFLTNKTFTTTYFSINFNGSDYPSDDLNLMHLMNFYLTFHDSNQGKLSATQYRV